MICWNPYHFANRSVVQFVIEQQKWWRIHSWLRVKTCCLDWWWRFLKTHGTIILIAYLKIIINVYQKIRRIKKKLSTSLSYDFSSIIERSACLWANNCICLMKFFCSLFRVEFTEKSSCAYFIKIDRSMRVTIWRLLNSLFKYSVAWRNCCNRVGRDTVFFLNNCIENTVFQVLECIDVLNIQHNAASGLNFRLDN